MKLPFVSPQTNLSSIDNIIDNPYEPKSVLDIRCSPPSPLISYSPDLTSFDNNPNLLLSSSSDETFPVENNEHTMITHFNNYDSNSLMRELGFYDDYNKSELPDFPTFFHSDFETLNYTYSNQNLFDLITQYDDVSEFDITDDLILLAECIETQSFQPAQVILARLNQRLRSPTGTAVQRVAFYFKEAIQSLLTGSTRGLQACTSYEIVQVIKAYNAFSTVSPIPMFSSFTANQAILDAMDGAMNVHVIDFDIGLGGQWSSFLKAVAEKAEARNVASPTVRITAVVPEEYELESRLIRDNLHQFSIDLKLGFEIDFVSIRVFEYLSFKSIKFMNGEKTAVVLSPNIFRRIGSDFVSDLPRVSPTVVVYVDAEMYGCGATLFRQMVIDGLKLYTTVLESMEAANIGGEWMRSVEMFVLLPKIMAALEYGGRNVASWREALGRAGMKAVGMSRFAEVQAEGLVRRVQVRGFHVVKQQTEMVLCWHDRPLVATSAWTFV